ncbi:Bax inhibitor-1/YccA family protein [Alloscardovia omnicolens]|uniref:Bax inhibitor-1/YccA family protein n=1 Tax=Alloscardovia omnicolens TaxID=419015 RepID=UPI003A69F690
MTDYMGSSVSGEQTAYEQPYIDVQSAVTDERAQRSSIARIYGEMTVGLLVTAAVAYASFASGLYARFLMTTGRFGFIALAIIQIAVIVFLSARALTMNPTTARVAFYAYAALMGFTLSNIFAVYSFGNIVLALAFTAAFFFALTMFALTTKMNLLKLGPILMVALIVLIIAEVIMMFMHIGVSTMILSGITLLLFAGFTAYDAQVARAMFAQYAGNEVMIKRVSILCALNLYLDFINFFISFLNLLNRD